MRSHAPRAARSWDASYNHGVTGSQTIFTGYAANDAINAGGNGVSITTDAHAQPGDFFVPLNTDSSSATHHNNNLHLSGKQASPMSPAMPYIFFCGLLTSQWTISGYDACVGVLKQHVLLVTHSSCRSAHMIEETKNGAIAGPHAILTAIGVSAGACRS